MSINEMQVAKPVVYVEQRELEGEIDRAEAVLGLTLLPFQRDVLRTVLEGKMVKMTMRSGKTTIRRVGAEILRERLGE